MLDGGDIGLTTCFDFPLLPCLLNEETNPQQSREQKAVSTTTATKMLRHTTKNRKQTVVRKTLQFYFDGSITRIYQASTHPQQVRSHSALCSPFRLVTPFPAEAQGARILARTCLAWVREVAGRGRSCVLEVSGGPRSKISRHSHSRGPPRWLGWRLFGRGGPDGRRACSRESDCHGLRPPRRCAPGAPAAARCVGVVPASGQVK